MFLHFLPHFTILSPSTGVPGIFLPLGDTQNFLLAIFANFWLSFAVEVGCKFVESGQLCVGIRNQCSILVSVFAVGIPGIFVL